MVRYRYKPKTYIFAFFVFWGIFSKHAWAANELMNVDAFDSFTVSSMNSTISKKKRTKEARQFDEIHKNNIHPQYEKETGLSEAYSQDTNPSYKHSRPQHNELGKYINYYKYGKQHNYNNPKYGEKGKKMQDVNECEQTKKPKYQCAAFVIGQIHNSRTCLVNSLNGGPFTIAAPYVAQPSSIGRVFSNKARGSYSPDYDLGVSYLHFDGTHLLYTPARFRHDGDQANLVYKSGTVGSANAFINGSAFVTDMSMTKGILGADAYNIGLVNDGGNDPKDGIYPHGYQQFNLNPKSGALISSIISQNMCTDIYFFNNKCSRWLCFGMNPGDTVYLRDPSTDTNYIPPVDNNPVANIDTAGFNAFWGTAARTCGTQYMSVIGKQNPVSAIGDIVDVQFVRAKVSLKYPYFEDIEMFYSTSREFSAGTFIHSPPDTNIVYACFGKSFWRFDIAYTAQVPVLPTVELSSVPWVSCGSITSFRECHDEVYVSTGRGVWYSRNGGRSFTLVDSGDFVIRFSHDLVGLAFPHH